MRSIVIPLFLCAYCTDGIAAGVEWNCFSLSEVSGHEYRLSYYRDIDSGYPDEVSIRAETVLKVSDVGVNGQRLVSAMPESAVLAFSGNWLAANIGDEVSAATTRNQASYFHHAFIDESPEELNTPGFTGMRSDYGIEMSANTMLLLIFAVEDANYLPWGKEIQSVFYGWVEMNMDSLGNLSLQSSAIDLDGRSMIAGGDSAIPEPSSALLLLVGGALLALRRRGRRRAP